jgi:hypothetical protein
MSFAEVLICGRHRIQLRQNTSINMAHKQANADADKKHGDNLRYWLFDGHKINARMLPNESKLSHGGGKS